MYSDNYILFLATIVCLLAIWLVFKLNKIAAIINLFAFGIYTVYGYYILFEPNLGEAALARWFYLMMLTILHTVCLLLYWFFSILKRR